MKHTRKLLKLRIFSIGADSAPSLLMCLCMKTLIRVLPLLALLPLSLFLVNCGKDGGNSTPTTYYYGADGQCRASNNPNQIVAATACQNTLAGQCTAQQLQLNPNCINGGINGGIGGIGGIAGGQILQGRCYGPQILVNGQAIDCDYQQCRGAIVIIDQRGQRGMCI